MSLPLGPDFYSTSSDDSQFFSDTDITAESNLTQYDFQLVIQNSNILRTAIDALSDPTFNPERYGIINVDEAGFQIISCNNQHHLGCLRLKAEGLKDFACTNPLKKAFSLSGISTFLRAPAPVHRDQVSMFVVTGCKELCISWTNSPDFDLALDRPASSGLKGVTRDGLDQPTKILLFDLTLPTADNAICPSIIFLAEAALDHGNFPSVSYVVEGAFASDELMDIICQGTQTEDQFRAALLSMEFNGIVSVAEVKAEVKTALLDVLSGWVYWGSLKCAIGLGKTCWICLVIQPKRVLLRIKVREGCDMVYLAEADYLNVIEDFNRYLSQ